MIDEGRRTASYKLALLLALIDRVAAAPAVEAIPTREVAVEVLGRYYAQARPYVFDDGSETELRQISMKNSPPVRAASTLRAAGEAAKCRSIEEVRQRLPEAHEAAVDVVEDTFVRRIATEDERLHSHLFGAQRRSFPKQLRDRLSEIQGGLCFYCAERLGRRRDVDHFLAWSRWPNDAVENLVIADRCNSDKRDHLAAAVHLQRWSSHVRRHASDLEQLADTTRAISDRSRTRGLVENTYSHIAPGTPLWIGGDSFELAVGPIQLDTA